MDKKFIRTTSKVEGISMLEQSAMCEDGMPSQVQFVVKKCD
jgi:hypothetical protein